MSSHLGNLILSVVAGPFGAKGSRGSELSIATASGIAGKFIGATHIWSIGTLGRLIALFGTACNFLVFGSPLITALIGGRKRG